MSHLINNQIKVPIVFLVGFEEDHPQDTYRVLDLKTQGFMLIRNVSWSGKTFGKFFQARGLNIMEGTEWEISDEDEIILQTNPADFQINEKEKEAEKYRILTRSRALVDAIEDEVSSDEKGMKLY
jgi:hypothetical protein